MANLYGKGADKLSFDGRVEFARDHMNQVFDSADNPFEGSRCGSVLPSCVANMCSSLPAVCHDTTHLFSTTHAQVLNAPCNPALACLLRGDLLKEEVQC